MASSRLNIQRNQAIDWLRDFINPDGASTVQVCISGRETEDAAVQRMAFGELLSPTNNPHTMNGQYVDLDTQLYCSKCARYLFDNQFPRDKTRISRRGRAYTCRKCKQ